MAKERRPLLFLTANSGLAHSGPGGPGKAQQRNRGATPAQMHDRKGGSKASQRHRSRGFWDGAVRGCLLRSVAHFRVGSKVYPMRAVLNFWQFYSSNPLFFTRFHFSAIIITNPSISCEPQDLKFIITLEKELKRGATSMYSLMSVHSELYHQRQLPQISEELERPCS